jgi:hypothetical protein
LDVSVLLFRQFAAYPKLHSSPKSAGCSLPGAYGIRRGSCPVVGFLYALTIHRMPGSLLLAEADALNATWYFNIV